jgi:GH24 family phage-related lysozyme (muramidase)
MVIKPKNYLLAIASLGLISCVSSSTGTLDVKSQVLLKTKSQKSAIKVASDFLLKVEGFEPYVYQDSLRYPTIGVGFNLNSPLTQEAFRFKKLNIGPYRASEAKMSLGLALELLNIKLNMLKSEIDSIKSRHFPKTKLNINQTATLLSLQYNSPRLIGPSLRRHLKNGDFYRATVQIITNSNKYKLPGIAKRRLLEAELFSGDDFSKIMYSLSTKDKIELYLLLNSIKNESERDKTLNKYKKYLI